MFMDYETWVDKVCAVIMIGGAVAFAIWWMAFFIPERDRKLWEINDCYVERGCNNLSGEHALESAKACWAECTDYTREENRRAGLAEL